MTAQELLSPPAAESVMRLRLHPLGYPAEIVTDSPEVLTIAAAAWDSYPRLSDSHPIELRIEVSPAEAGPSPSCSCHLGYLFTVVQGANNFAIADLRSGVGLFRISGNVLKDRPWFLYHFLEPAAYLLLAARHFVIVHAACVALAGRAVLLCGPSGAGKTCLAYACARRGWSFLSGDATQLVRAEREPTVIGRPFSLRFRPSASALFPEFSNFPARLRPNGKFDLELDSHDLGLSTSVRAQAGAVVFLNRVSNLRAPEIEPLPRRSARESLIDSPRIGEPHVLAEQEETLDRLLEKPCVRLTYSDPFEAELLLRAVLEEAG